jgi:EAL domain-containing protein (putative c-di-GMP-specific phosphodiesterase class I)
VIWVSLIVAALLCIAVLILLVRHHRKQSLLQKNLNPITGLYNKSYLDDILGSLIHDFLRARYYAVCISANYEALLKYYGKDPAQSLANYIASTLKSETQEGEFGVHADDDIMFLWLIQAATQEQAEKRVSDMIEKLNRENGILNEDYHLAISAGCYGLSQARESGERIHKITSEAYFYAEENALNYFFADSNFIKMVDRKARLQKETVQAVKKGQILFYLQYIVDIQSNRIVGAEALSRWEHPREGLLFPGVYIPLMRHAKNIHLLDYYMFEKCCQQLRRWSMDKTKDLLISCNFDRQTAARDDFYEQIMSISEKYGIDRSRFILEITEETFVYNQENVIQNTRLLREASFRVALDDFGNGSTSFQNLIEYHVSYLKMDRIFVEIMQTEQGEKLVNGIIKAAHALGLPILQEGVETTEQLEKCKSLKIDLVQGFVFSRVIPSIEEERVRRRLLTRLADGAPPVGLQTYADVNPDAEEDNVYEDDDEGNPFGTRYRWSFLARLHRAPEEIAAYYSDLKNTCLKYKKVRARVSWSYDTISYKHAPVAKFVMRQKSLLLYLALNPSDFEETKYFFTDASEKKKYAQVPLRLKIRGSRGYKHAIELIEELAARLEWKEKNDFTQTDYTLPPKSVEELIDDGLIKVNGQAINTDTIPAQEPSEQRANKSLASQIPNLSIVKSITEESNTEEITMENNNALTQNLAEFIYGTYYRWSFTGRLHQAPENVASYYNDIKNAFLRYKKVKSRISWSCDTITFGREQLAKLVLTQKTLYVYLALSPKELEGTKYFFTDESNVQKYEKVPLRVRVKSDRGVKHTIELIEKIAESKGLQLLKDFEATDYSLPYESVESLLERQLVKKIEVSDTAPAVDPECNEEAVAAAVMMEEPVTEELPAPEDSVVEETTAPQPAVEEPAVEEAVIVETNDEAPVTEDLAIEESTVTEGAGKTVTTIKQTPAEEIQNADLIDTESIHVDFLQRICKQFDADELNAHVKVIYKKKKEKKTSIFDIVMKKNRS